MCRSARTHPAVVQSLLTQRAVVEDIHVVFLLTNNQPVEPFYTLCLSPAPGYRDQGRRAPGRVLKSYFICIFIRADDLNLTSSTRVVEF